MSATDNEDPKNRPMTRRGPDGRVHETAEMEERARDAQHSGQQNRRWTPSVPLRGPPD